jgi:biopolymer transport protein ExbB/TolQ
MTTNLPSQSSSTPPALAFDSGLEDKSPNPSTSSRGPRQYRAITHVATLTAFVLPIFLLPYLLTRRRLSLINQRIDKVGANARVLQQDLNGIYSELAVRKDEHRRLKALVYDTMRETDELQLQAEQQDAKQSASNESIRSDIQKLLDETQYTR